MVGGQHRDGGGLDGICDRVGVRVKGDVEQDSHLKCHGHASSSRPISRIRSRGYSTLFVAIVLLIGIPLLHFYVGVCLIEESWLGCTMTATS